MKKVIYSKFTKFIVWLLIIALTVPFINCLYDGLNDYMELGGDNVYAFGKDFESSYYVSSLLNMPINAVGYAYMDSRIASSYTVHGNGSISAQHREYTAVPVPTVMPSFEEPVLVTPNPEATPMPTPTPRPTASPAEAPQENESPYEAIEERIASFAEDERIEYYIKVNDRVYSNTDDGPDELMERKFSYFTYRASDGSGEKSWNGYKGHLTGFGSYNINTFGEDEISVCTAIVDSHAEEMRQVWQEQEQIVKSAFERLLVIFGAIFALAVFLLATAGKTAAGVDERGLMDKLWTEIYLAAAVAAGVGGVCLVAALFDELFESVYNAYYGGIPEYMALPLVYITAALMLLIVLGCLVMCVRKLRQGRFLKDSVCWALLSFAWRIAKALIIWLFRALKTIWKFFVHTWRELSSETKALMAKKTGRWLIGGLSIFSFLLWLCGTFTPDAPIFLLFAAAIFAAAVYALIKRSRDMDEIRKGTKEIRGGKLSYKIAEPHSADLKELAADINHIAQGLDESVAAKLKAERMKTELITNVSHDLKTPLTSMISYTELLSQVDGLPEEAQDYIKIIASKSDRLKKLTQDLFDISKVQSGSENIVMERLDAALLIEQALAEREVEIKESSLNFIVNTEKELFFMADGKKMSRAVGNLIENALKYSMSGTRVFISAKGQDERLVMEFKNIASYLMDFDPEEIVGRFVRGDDSRSTEGSGLGLAIAKSYVEACRGSFELLVDGDLFKVSISFDKC